MRNSIFGLFIILIFTGCDTDKMSKTSDTQFLGDWKLSGRSMFEGIEVKITKDKNNVMKGTIIKLNDNKYIQIFMEVGDVLITGITRNSNFKFTVKEKKIAHRLFSAYGQSTTKEYIAQFESKNKILLGKEGSDGFYIRVNK